MITRINNIGQEIISQEIKTNNTASKSHTIKKRGSRKGMIDLITKLSIIKIESKGMINLKIEIRNTDNLIKEMIKDIEGVTINPINKNHVIIRRKMYNLEKNTKIIKMLNNKRKYRK